jgi:hypothetical protein
MSIDMRELLQIAEALSVALASLAVPGKLKGADARGVRVVADKGKPRLTVSFVTGDDIYISFEVYLAQASRAYFEEIFNAVRSSIDQKRAERSPLILPSRTVTAEEVHKALRTH